LSLLIKPVYAGCVGGFSCGTDIVNCTCSNGVDHNDCWSSCTDCCGEWPNIGDCTCTQDCGGDAGNFQCAERRTDITCLTEGGCGTGYDCVIDYGCHFSDPPPPEPTQAPDPGEEGCSCPANYSIWCKATGESCSPCQSGTGTCADSNNPVCCCCPPPGNPEVRIRLQAYEDINCNGFLDDGECTVEKEGSSCDGGGCDVALCPPEGCLIDWRKTGGKSGTINFNTSCTPFSGLIPYSDLVNTEGTYTFDFHAPAGYRDVSRTVTVIDTVEGGWRPDATVWFPLCCPPSCPSGCDCGSSSYCCGEWCGEDGCGGDCGYESDSDVGNCPTESGDGRYCGSSLPNDPCGGDCGNEADYRSSSWSSPDDDSSIVHDLPITVSGWAKDTNGANTGVNSVSIDISGTSGYTANVDASTGSFSKSITADFYSLGFTGTESHTISLTTNPRDPEDCSGWSLGTRTINITNSSPSNISFSPNSGNLILDHDPDGNKQVEFTAIFNDADPVPVGRYHDVHYGKVRFGEATDPLLLLEYTDNGDSTYDIDITGGSESGNITLVNSSRSKNADNLTINFTLDFANMSPDAAGTYNIYQYAQDWAGVVADWEYMGNLVIWNGSDVDVSGRVYDITYYYPNTMCKNLDDADPHASGLASPQITFRWSSGPGSDVVVDANGSGNYSTVLTYGTTYIYTLFKPDYSASIADVSDATLTSGDCLLGETAAFTLNNGPTVVGLDFGMSEVKNPWIQVVGGDLTSYGSISDLIPSTCVNDYNDGGCCLPFISINRLPDFGSLPCNSDLFSENGLVAAQVGPVEVWYGDGISSGYPHDWQVVTSLWRRPTGTGFTYFRNLLGEDYVLTGNKDISSPDLDSAEGTVSDGHIGSTEKVIKLIDGNLTINQNTVVDPGGILLLVASGNIIVNGDVDRVDGIFSADDNININSGTAGQAILQGSWSAGADGTGTLTNSRDLGSDNNLNPAAVFQYRPDFMVSLLKQNEGLKPKIKWEEVKP